MTPAEFERTRAVPSNRGGADAVRRGAARLLAATGQAVLAEVPLVNGRRADLVALDHAGRISIVEIKSCRSDSSRTASGGNMLAIAICSILQSQAISRVRSCPRSTA